MCHALKSSSHSYNNSKNKSLLLIIVHWQNSHSNCCISRCIAITIHSKINNTTISDLCICLTVSYRLWETHVRSKWLLWRLQGTGFCCFTVGWRWSWRRHKDRTSRVIWRTVGHFALVIRTVRCWCRIRCRHYSSWLVQQWRLWRWRWHWISSWLDVYAVFHNFCLHMRGIWHSCNFSTAWMCQWWRVLHHSRWSRRSRAISIATALFTCRWPVIHC